MDKIYIFGHKNPDCDSSVAPKVYEWYLKQKGMDAEAVVLGKLNNEAKWVYRTFGVAEPRLMSQIPEESKVIIVDATEPKQLPDNWESFSVKEIWDHHNLAGLKTKKPVKAVIDTVGCTCTLLYEFFKANGVAIEPKMAGLMLSAISSDILDGKSPTATERDKAAVIELAKIAQIEVAKHVAGQFKAKSSLEGMNVADIVNADAKEFEMSGKKVKIGIVETVDPAQAMAKRDEIKQVMKQEKGQKGLDFFYFIVDIMNNYAVPVVVGEEERMVLTKAYNQSITDNCKLEGVVSRKKQMVPQIEKALA